MKYLLNVSTLILDTGLCNGCRNCLEVCPRLVFTFKDKKAVIQDKDLCIECGACQRNCAAGAIKVRAGVGCASAIIQSRGKEEITCGESCCGDTSCC